MIDAELKFPDWSGHPAPPRMSFEEYEAWITGEILPALRAAGKLSDEELRRDFERNEGLMTEAFRL